MIIDVGVEENQVYKKNCKAALNLLRDTMVSS